MRNNHNGIEELNRRRSEEGSAQNSRAWAVATPLWTASQPPNAFRRRGSLPPKLSSRFVRSVAGRVVTKKA
jgi:hypothetical protein